MSTVETGKSFNDIIAEHQGIFLEEYLERNLILVGEDFSSEFDETTTNNTSPDTMESDCDTKSNTDEQTLHNEQQQHFTDKEEEKNKFTHLIRLAFQFIELELDENKKIIYKLKENTESIDTTTNLGPREEFVRIPEEFDVLNRLPKNIMHVFLDVLCLLDDKQSDVVVDEICRWLKISHDTFYSWALPYGGGVYIEKLRLHVIPWYGIDRVPGLPLATLVINRHPVDTEVDTDNGDSYTEVLVMSLDPSLDVSNDSTIGKCKVTQVETIPITPELLDQWKTEQVQEPVTESTVETKTTNETVPAEETETTNSGVTKVKKKK